MVDTAVNTIDRELPYGIYNKRSTLVEVYYELGEAREQSLRLFSTQENHLQHLCAYRFPCLPIPPASDSLGLRKGNQNIHQVLRGT